MRRGEGGRVGEEGGGWEGRGEEEEEESGEGSATLSQNF